MGIRITLFIFLILGFKSLNAQLYINEWMASNSAAISDPEFDESGDWIEIYNDDSEEIDLSGYYLTDNLNKPTKWTIPQGTSIEPNGFLLLWADGREIGLHTSFKLTREAEEIGLYDRDTLILDQIQYSNQKTNVSMGRKSDGDSALSYFLESTPGESNTSTAYDGITFHETQFDITGGIYSTSKTISLNTINGDIRYTTDGSFPTIESLLYAEPIIIDNTTIIRATVFQDRYIPGKTITHTFFIGEDKNIQDLPVISLSGNPEHFWDESIGIYVQDFKPEWEYPINIELFENDGSNRAAINELAGTKVNGLNSWVLPQKMLGIYFDNDYDKNNLDYNLFFEKG